MVKISKSLQAKHKDSMSDWLDNFVWTATNAELPTLPRELERFPLRWPLPRGDLYHWIPLLNRFDNILECFVETYGLRTGPQMRDFGCEILLRTASHPVDYRDDQQWGEEELARLGFGKDGDHTLVLAILKFTRCLLQHCGNRSIYASSAHLNSLLNTTSIEILQATLHVSYELALRYHASYKRARTSSRVFHAALLQNHYDIDLERVQQLALPFAKTPIAGSSVPALSAHPFPTPASASAKGKEKADSVPTPATTSAPSKAATTMYTNDFIAIAADGPGEPANRNSSGTESSSSWEVWGDVKITYYPERSSRQSQEVSDVASPQNQRGGASEQAAPTSSAPSTPTPHRRSSAMGSQDRTPRAERIGSGSGFSADDSPLPTTPMPVRILSSAEDRTGSGQRSFEIPYHALQSCSIYELMTRCPADMPTSSRYEVLNRLRIAKALLGSTLDRQTALAVRLLAITNLAFIHPEMTFLDKVLKQDSEEPRRFQLTCQLADLIRPGAGRIPLPIWLQSIALQLMESLAGFSSKNAEVMSAVNASVNHGVLLYVLRKAVADMKEDKPETVNEVAENDEWRKQLFSLTLHLTAGNRMPDMMTAGLMDILIDALNVRSKIAERNYLVVVTFLDTVVLNFPTTFQHFATAHGLEAISQLLIDVTTLAKQMAEAGEGTPTNMHCSAIDYSIPFYLQQTLKWLLKFIYHLMASSFQFGPGTDRLLRNLVDNSQLLLSLRTILENTALYGSVVWTNAGTTMSHFINHDPTSFTVLSESRLIQSFLEAITGRPLPEDVVLKGASDENRHGPRPDQGRPGEDGGPATDSVDPMSPNTSADASGSASQPAAGGSGTGGSHADGEDESSDDGDLPSQEDESLGVRLRSGPLTSEELTRPRNHTLANGILPSTEAIGAIPSILNAISLNNTGRRMLVQSGVFESYFEIFESAPHIRCMENEPGLPPNIGGNFDELARHHPPLRIAIANAVIGMVSRVRYLVEKNAETANWGVKFHPVPPVEDEQKDAQEKGKDVAMDTAAEVSTATATASEDIEMADAEASEDKSDSAVVRIKAPLFVDAGPYINAVALFFTSYQNHQRLQSFFIEMGGTELILDLATGPGLNFNPLSVSINQGLHHVLTSLFDHSAVIGVPSLLLRTMTALDDLEHVFKFHTNRNKDYYGNEKAKGKAEEGDDDADDGDNDGGCEKPKGPCFFQPYIFPRDTPLPADQVAEGTATIKKFAKALYLVKTLQVCFPSSRQGSMSYNVNVHDYIDTLIKKLGTCLVFILDEEDAIASNAPERWINKAAQSMDVLAGLDGSDLADIDKLTEADKTSDAYRNFNVVQMLLPSFMPSIVRVFQCVGKALHPRRDRDSYARYQQLRLAETLAKTMLEQLKLLDPKRPAAYKQSQVLLMALCDLLIDHTRQNEHGSSGGAHVIIPVLLGFKWIGGFDVLNAILRGFAEQLAEDPEKSQEPFVTSSPELYRAGIGMKRILDLYAILVSSRLSESVSSYSVFNRSNDRTAMQQAGQQLLLEIRLAVLPVIVDLWNSDIAEKISTTLLTRVVDILRTVMTGRTEESCFTRAMHPKVSPTNLFEGERVYFDWSHTDRETENTNFARDLMDESMFRSNSLLHDASEYCTAQTNGLAGPRHPIPTDEAERHAQLLAARHSEVQANAATAATAAAASASGTSAVSSAGGSATRPALPRLSLPLDVVDSMALDSSHNLNELFESVVGNIGNATAPTPPRPTATAGRSSRSHDNSGTEGTLPDLVALSSLVPSLMTPSPLRQQLTASSSHDGNSENGESASDTGEEAEESAPIPVTASGSAVKSETSTKGTPKKSSKDRTKTAHVVVREDLDDQRKQLRDDLVDRSLAVVQNHPNAVYEISDLISTSVLKQANPDEDNILQEVGETLTRALESFAIGEEHQMKHAQSIAAYAHLLCLLIQDVEPFFHATIGCLQDSMDVLLSFLKVPSSSSSEELPPWLPHFYLLFEILATEDEQLPNAKWNVPGLDKNIEPLQFDPKPPILNEVHNKILLESSLDILPRIGKNEVLAVSVSRLLVILTRRRDVAKTVGDKKNLQRLFLMAKQLAGIGAGGFKETRIGANIVTVLRHIAEDDEVLRQVMRAEIQMFFEDTQLRREGRSQDFNTFLQYMAHASLRSPDLFASVAEEMVQIIRWQNSDSYRASSFSVTLKTKASNKDIEKAADGLPAASNDDSLGPAVQLTEDLNINDVRPSTEQTGTALATVDGNTKGNNTKNTGSGEAKENEMPDVTTTATTAEHKRPIVENPDGVITFLLEQLMMYQKVDDVEPHQAGKDDKVPLGRDIGTPPFSRGSGNVLSDSLGNSEGATPAPVSAAGPSSPTAASETSSAEPVLPNTDKKGSSSSKLFQPSENPIFVFRGFLIFCLTELLQSYTRTKMEFINFKRGVALQTHTPVKPRTSVLNYLLNDVLCAGAANALGSTLVPAESAIVSKKKQAMADQARRLLVSLVERTSERPFDRTRSRYELDDDTDLLFVRRFVLDTILKAYKEAAASTEPLNVRYGKMTALAELMANMIGGDKDRSLVNHTPFSQTAMALSQLQLRRLMYEKDFLAALTVSIADVDLAFPGIKRMVKQVLRVLNALTGTALDLSRANITTSCTADAAEYDTVSSSSLSEMEEDDREDTPDLYRNSSLGMLEGGDPDEYSDESDDEGDQDMYDADMDYEDEMSDGDEENVSDDEEEEDEMARVDRLNTEHGVVELVMGDGDEDDEDDEDEDDEDGEDEDDEDEDDEDDEDEVGSEDMQDIEDQIEAIEELEEDGLHDDGASGWESETSEDDGEEDDDDDDDDEFDGGGAVAADHQRRHRRSHHNLTLENGDPIDPLDDLARAMNPAFMGEGEAHGAHYEDPYVEDDAEDEDEDEDEGMDEDDDYIYDYPDPAALQQEMPVSLTWDALVIDQNGHPMGGNHAIARPRTGGLRSPFPPFVFGGPSHDTEFGNIFRVERPGAGGNVDDAVNPLLRRSGGAPRDSSGNRAAPTGAGLGLIGGAYMPPLNTDRHGATTVRLGMGSETFSGPDNPVNFLNELMASLPNLGSRGQSLQLHILPQALRNEIRDLTSFLGAQRSIAESRLVPESRVLGGSGQRESSVEPHQAISFRVSLTRNRWADEAKMVFGPRFGEKGETWMFNRVLVLLAPAAIEEALREKARKQAERQEEEKRRREEEERRAHEEEERKEREAAELREREEREQAEQAEQEEQAALAAAAGVVAAEAEAAAEAAEAADEPLSTSEPMEGVQAEGEGEGEGTGDETSGAAHGESGEEGTAGSRPAGESAEQAPAQPQQRITTTIRGEEIDVTGLGIDAEYLAALPEEFREEVIASTLTARRSEARQRAESTGEQMEDFNEFLDALPDDVRSEIMQQERQDQRRRQREEERRPASGRPGAAAAAAGSSQSGVVGTGSAATGAEASGGVGSEVAQEMDTASILMTFPLELREQILMEQGDELHDLLPPNMQHLVRSLIDRHRSAPSSGSQRARQSRGDDAQSGSREPASSAAATGSAARVVAGPSVVVPAKVERRPVIQMLDKSGVATLLRLLFATQQGSTRNNLFGLFMDLCQNRQTRLEVIGTLLQVLQDGSSDMEAVERCFGQLSAKARGRLEAAKMMGASGGAAGVVPGTPAGASSGWSAGPPGTPSGAIVTTPASAGSRRMVQLQAAAAVHLDSSPLLIMQQCLELLVDLCSKNMHISSLFLTEHDLVGASLRKPASSRKGKGSMHIANSGTVGSLPLAQQQRAARFGINMLLLLLEKELVMESSSVMQLVADLLNKVTLPLQALERRRRELEAERKRAAKKKREEEAAEKDKAKPAVEGEGAGDEERSGPSTSTAATAVLVELFGSTEAAEGSSSGAGAVVPEGDASRAEGAEAAARGDAAAVAAAGEQAQTPAKRELEPPMIPDSYMALVVNIFVARECGSKTFQNTIATIKNLSCISSSKKRLFGRELLRQAKVLSSKILEDLQTLLPHIESAETGTEIQGIALAKFSPGAAEQNKLLRVLTALDHLFGGEAEAAIAAAAKEDKKNKKDRKDRKDKEDKEGKETAEYEDEKIDYMGELYGNSTFMEMWEQLSRCLGAIRQRDNMLNVATILLPLIESLMVVCKTGVKHAEKLEREREADGSTMLLVSSPPPEGQSQSQPQSQSQSQPQGSLFFSFTEEHRRVLNELVRINPKLMSGTFALLVRNPKVLEFDNKRNYFNRSVHAKQTQNGSSVRPMVPALQLSVRREQVFHDSFRSLYFKSGDEMKYGKLNIRFHGEEGVDAGGVTREWFQVLARQMFDANYALFIPVSSDRTTFHPNKLSGINDEHLMFFKFIGRIIGKALYEGRLLDCYFSRAVYKRILGKPVSVKDMESFDPEYYKSLVWMLENDITDVITETFSVVDDEFGVTTVNDLVDGGRDVVVTEENKHDYVRLVVEHKLLASVRDQMEHFLRGFHDIIPAELISIFNEQELELLISGLPDIDLDDWRSHTEYHNYTAASPQIQWFWRAVRSFDKEERAKLLQFVTGTSKVPLNGFKELEGMNGVNRFNIHRDYGDKERLPSSHTCFNQLDLPEYDSYETLRSQVLKAITAGNEYFGFA